MLLSGCGARGGLFASFRPLEQLRLVETLGYDAGPTLSAAVSGTETQPPLALAARGRSLPDAVDALQAKTDRGLLFFAHSRFVLLGDGAAREGIAPLLDYMERDVHMRLDTKLVLLDRAAESVLTAECEDFDVTEALAAALREAEAQSCGLVTDLRETALALSEAGAAPVALLRCEFSDAGVPGLTPDGCGVLTGGALAGTLSRPEAEALGLALGRAGTLTREAEGAALLCRGSGELTLTDRSAPAFTLRLDVRVAVDEARQPLDAARLEAALEAQLAADAEAMLARLRELDADLLGLRASLRRVGVTELPEDWLRRAEVTVRVSATVDRSFDLDQPLKGDAHGP